MAEPRVTVAVVPRERFSLWPHALESIAAHLDTACDVVVVDAGSPAEIEQPVRRICEQRGFRRLRLEGFVSPNEARNLAARETGSPFIVFVDNDVVVRPGWVDALLACADETGAAVVGPLYLDGAPGSERVHMAGGLARIAVEDGRRVFREKHHFARRSPAEVVPKLRRHETESFEFHCALVRRSVLGRLGPFDERLPSINEHNDFAMAVRAGGGSVWCEPKAVVTYLSGRTLTPLDRSFFEWRWSDAANRASVERFREKWQLDAHDPFLANAVRWGRHHRERGVKSLGWWRFVPERLVAATARLRALPPLRPGA